MPSDVYNQTPRSFGAFRPAAFLNNRERPGTIGCVRKTMDATGSLPQASPGNLNRSQFLRRTRETNSASIGALLQKSRRWSEPQASHQKLYPCSMHRRPREKTRGESKSINIDVASLSCETHAARRLEVSTVALAVWRLTGGESSDTESGKATSRLASARSKPQPLSIRRRRLGGMGAGAAAATMQQQVAGAPM